MEKTKIEEVAAAMESNELPSQLHYANLSSLSLADESITQICTNMGNEDISFVRVVIANDKALSYKRELKVSFSDRIATFGNEYLINLFWNIMLKAYIFLGGTMGLFTGMSLLSLVELIFWMWKCLQGFFHKRTVNNVSIVQGS